MALIAMWHNAVHSLARPDARYAARTSGLRLAIGWEAGLLKICIFVRFLYETVSVLWYRGRVAKFVDVKDGVHFAFCLRYKTRFTVASLLEGEFWFYFLFKFFHKQEQMAVIIQCKTCLMTMPREMIIAHVYNDHGLISGRVSPHYKPFKCRHCNRTFQHVRMVKLHLFLQHNPYDPGTTPDDLTEFDFLPIELFEAEIAAVMQHAGIKMNRPDQIQDPTAFPRL